VKIDLLGNRSLAVIRDALAEVRRYGQPFDEARWQPEDDPATQALVAKGATMGCFYIESPATRLLQQKAVRGDYEHLVIHSSIIRPAANVSSRTTCTTCTARPGGPCTLCWSPSWPRPTASWSIRST